MNEKTDMREQASTVMNLLIHKFFNELFYKVLLPNMCSFWTHIQYSPKVMADFFETQKLTWCPHPICMIFGGCIKCVQAYIICAKHIDFLH